MFPLPQHLIDQAKAKVGITDLSKATIRQICALAAQLESITATPYIHLEIGNPGLQPEQIGVEAECKALKSGIASHYPDIAGIAPLKNAASRFISAFIDLDLPPDCIVPTVGSMQGSFTLMLLMKHLSPQKDTILFIDPGFPAQHSQAHVIGLKSRSFDIYPHRGAEPLRRKLNQMLADNRVAAIIYSNPNNPAWINLTDQELQAIGQAATDHDAIVLEDHAYLGMDFRTDFSHPFQSPYIPTVARYTDNCILLISASKIFSYAGQRIACVAFGKNIARRQYPHLNHFFGISSLIDAYIFGVLYSASSGTAHSAQCALAAMMDAAADGRLNFVDHTAVYAHRCSKARQIFTDHGFRLVYSHDGPKPVSDGFFITLAYGNLSGMQLAEQLLRHGIATIPLSTTGSTQQGLRVCSSMITSDTDFETLASRLDSFVAHNPTTD